MLNATRTKSRLVDQTLVSSIDVIKTLPIKSGTTDYNQAKTEELKIVAKQKLFHIEIIVYSDYRKTYPSLWVEVDLTVVGRKVAIDVLTE